MKDSKKLVIVFIAMVVYCVLVFGGSRLYRNHKMISHRKSILENINRFEYNKEASDIPTSQYYFHLHRDSTYQTGNRDTNLIYYGNYCGNLERYFGIFWDYRDSFQVKSSWFDKATWDDYTTEGYMISQDTTSKRYKLDKQIILAFREKIKSIK